jgi:hypothetical protein
MMRENQECSIHADRLTRLVANGFGFSQVAESRKVAILRPLREAFVRTSRIGRLAAVAHPGGVGRVPQNLGGTRPPARAHSAEEIVNAMVDVTGAVAGASREERVR